MLLAEQQDPFPDIACRRNADVLTHIGKVSVGRTRNGRTELPGQDTYRSYVQRSSLSVFIILMGEWNINININRVLKVATFVHPNFSLGTWAEESGKTNRDKKANCQTDRWTTMRGERGENEKMRRRRRMKWSAVLLRQCLEREGEDKTEDSFNWAH